MSAIIDNVQTSVLGPQFKDNNQFLLLTIQKALKRAGCTASEAIHVGDEPFVDGIGASRVGICPVLLDRLGVHADIRDYASIRSLDELAGMIDSLAA